MRYLAALAFAAIAAVPAEALAVSQDDFVQAVQNAPASAYIMPTLVVLLAGLLVIIGMARVTKQS